MRPLLAFLCLALTLLAGCVSCPPEPDLERLPGESLATPEATLEYFKAALTHGDDGSPDHEYLCFSEAMKQRFLEEYGQRLSLTNYLYGRDQLLEPIQEAFGSFERIEVGEARYLPDQPDRAVVEIRAGRERTTIPMILENSYFVVWRTPGDRSDGLLPRAQSVPSIDGTTLTLRIPMDPPPLGTGEDVYRLQYERAWKILWIDEAFLRRFQQRLQQQSPKPQARAS